MTVPAQQIERLGGDEDGQGGVQAAGQPHHGAGGVCVLQPLFQPPGGDGEDFLTALLPGPRVRRDEGGGGDGAGEGGFLPLKFAVIREGIPIAGRGGVGVHPLPLIGQPLYVNLADGQPGAEPALRKQRPIFRDHVVPREYQVGGALPLPRIGVDIAAHQPPGLACHQLAAVIRLAGHLIAGGQVQDEGGPLRRQPDGRGRRGPQILADLHADDQPRHRPAFHQRMGGHAHRQSRQFKFTAIERLGRGGKPAGLIEFPVIGDMDFGGQRQDRAFLYYCGAVIQFVLASDRQAQGGEHIQPPGLFQNPRQRPLRPVQQGGLQKQVAAGVPGDAQLRQGQHLYTLRGRFLHQGNDLPRIVFAVRHPDFRRTRRRLYKAVSHPSGLLKIVVGGILLQSS